MKRDARLQGLTSDHHHALVIASRVAKEWERAPAGLVGDVLTVYRDELAPHFLVEEELLLPALDAAGLPALVTRTRTEHQAIRAHLAAAEAGDPARLRDFASALVDHVRFEERELFPAAEQALPAAVLDAIAARCPHLRGGSRG